MMLCGSDNWRAPINILGKNFVNSIKMTYFASQKMNLLIIN